MSEAEEKVAAAVESVAASEEAQAAASVEVANAVVTQKSTEAAAAVVATAEVAAAQAHQVAAAVQADAAETIAETEGELSWLKANQEQMANSLQNQSQQITELTKTVAPMAEGLASALTALQSLTPKASVTTTETQTTVQPIAESKKEDAQKATENQKQSRKKRWI